MSTNASWTCCLQCRTSSRAGCFLCIAHQSGRTTCCALCAQTVCGGLLRHTTEAFGSLWECVCTLLNISSRQHQSTRDTATLPLSLGGLGLRSAVRTSPSAFWTSWADCLPMIIRELDGHPVTPCLSAASRIARDLVGVGGFEPPSWISLATGARPHMRQPEDYELWRGRVFRDAVLMPRLARHEQALLRSQSGPMAGAPLTCVPTSPLLQFDPQLFRIILLRRLLSPSYSHVS